VDSFTEAFNAALAFYPQASYAGDESWIKSIYVDAMPWKVREHVTLDKHFTAMSLVELQTECKRLQ
jgi:hypothetical protein